MEDLQTFYVPLRLGTFRWPKTIPMKMSSLLGNEATLQSEMRKASDQLAA